MWPSVKPVKEESSFQVLSAFMILISSMKLATGTSSLGAYLAISFAAVAVVFGTFTEDGVGAFRERV